MSQKALHLFDYMPLFKFGQNLFNYRCHIVILVFSKPSWAELYNGIINDSFFIF